MNICGKITKYKGFICLQHFGFPTICITSNVELQWQVNTNPLWWESEAIQSFDAQSFVLLHLWRWKSKVVLIYQYDRTFLFTIHQELSNMTEDDCEHQWLP